MVDEDNFYRPCEEARWLDQERRARRDMAPRFLEGCAGKWTRWQLLELSLLPSHNLASPSSSLAKTSGRRPRSIRRNNDRKSTQRGPRCASPLLAQPLSVFSTGRLPQLPKSNPKRTGLLAGRCPSPRTSPSSSRSSRSSRRQPKQPRQRSRQKRLPKPPPKLR